MKLTLIRHGMTRGNMLHIYYGSTDLPILPESYTELEARAKRASIRPPSVITPAECCAPSRVSRYLRGHSAQRALRNA